MDDHQVVTSATSFFQAISTRRDVAFVDLLNFPTSFLAEPIADTDRGSDDPSIRSLDEFRYLSKQHITS